MTETIEQIKHLITIAEKMRNAYFFDPPCSSRMRRDYEKRYSTDLITWEESGNIYTAKFTTECSCRYVYTYGRYTKNGVRTNLKAIRYSLKRLEENNKNNSSLG